MKLILISILALSSVTADPAVILSGLLPPGLTSAALIAPGPAPLVAPVAPLAYSQLAPYTSVLSDYRYSYSSSYQDYYPVVSSALTMPYTPIPYAYSTDWYYRN